VIDIGEDEILKTSDRLLDILLKDHSTKRNICWATEDYMSYGEHYCPSKPITKELITGENAGIICPRVKKPLDEQTKRTKDKAEVFTPSWVCNIQNNLIDESWFGRKDVFNSPSNQTWVATEDKIQFPVGKDWKMYVDATRLEVSCGEAPYLVSRYDSVSGEEIPIAQRIGLLDRKLRVVKENTESEEEWFLWAKRAFEGTYGFEYQGDNLLIARENLLLTFIEAMDNKFFHGPTLEQMLQIANVISWNLWQMDGLTMAAPFSGQPKDQMSLFEEEEEDETEPIPCIICDWSSGSSLEFRSITRGGTF